MLFHSETPAPPLATFVDYLWLYSDAPRHPRERILPSGTFELVFNLRDDEFRIQDPAGGYRRFSGAMVSGPYARFFVIDATQQASIIGVHVKAGGAAHLLGIPADELADTHVDLETLWGPSARELRERLCAAATPEQRLRILETALMTRLLRPAERHRLVLEALAALDAPGVRVLEVARRAGLSQRRFIQVFSEHVGMTPKLCCRVRRFQRALALAERTPAPDWARLALACGYFDQSHLIRDFVAFSGLTPATYLGARSEHVKMHHVPMIEPGQVRPIRPPAADGPSR
jgi:AraC-like DNA-binding protein